MKLSEKLIVFVFSVYILIQLVNVFYIRNQFKIKSGSIVNNDGFYSKEVIPFKHLKILSFALHGAIVKVKNSKKYEVKNLPDFDNLVKYESRQDTLLITIKEGYYNIENSLGAFPITVLLPELESMTLENCRLKLKDYNDTELTIIGKNKANISIEGNPYLQVLKLNLKKESNLTFDISKPHKMKNINANLMEMSSLNIQKVFPDAIKLLSSDDSSIEANGSTLKKIN